MQNFLHAPLPQLIRRTGERLYIRPHPLLQPHIAHYTLSYAVEENGPETLCLVPDASGCLVFTFGESRTKGMFWGPTTKMVEVTNDLDKRMRFFVEFLPCGAHRFTGIPQRELTDVRMDIGSIPSFSQLTEIAEQTEDLQRLVERMDRFFLRLLERRTQGGLPILLLPELQRWNGTLPVKALSEESCYSERHLNRLFRESLGMGVKTYSRLLRINEALREMQAGGVSLTEIAHRLRYYDQAHFIRDFKMICGVTPSAYMRRMNAFYYESYKFPAAGESEKQGVSR